MGLSMPPLGERTAAFEKVAREYGVIMDREVYVGVLLALRRHALNSQDPKAFLPELTRLFDGRNNDASGAMEDCRIANLDGNPFRAAHHFNEMIKGFGDENLTLAVRFELEGVAEGMLGCLNDAKAWALVHTFIRILHPEFTTLKTWTDMLGVFEMMQREEIVNFAGIDFIPLGPSS